MTPKRKEMVGTGMAATVPSVDGANGAAQPVRWLWLFVFKPLRMEYQSSRPVMSIVLCSSEVGGISISVATLAWLTEARHTISIKITRVYTRESEAIRSALIVGDHTKRGLRMRKCIVNGCARDGDARCYYARSTKPVVRPELKSSSLRGD